MRIQVAIARISLIVAWLSQRQSERLLPLLPLLLPPLLLQ